MDAIVGATVLEWASAPASVTPRAPRPRRDQAIETLRIVATFGVVVFHAGSEAEFVQASLIIFGLLSPLLDVRMNWTRVRSVRQIATALLVPWAFWMIVYGAVNLALARPLVTADGPVAGVLYGTSHHLWFLPYLFVVLLATNALKAVNRRLVPFWICMVTALVVMTTAWLWRPVSMQMGPPYAQWMFVTPAVFSGVALGLAPKIRHSVLLAIAVIGLGLIVMNTQMLPRLGLPYLVGVTATMLTVCLGERWMVKDWNVQAIANCMLGVYLCHFMWLRLINLAGLGIYFTATLTFACALGSVWAARRFIPASKLVLG